MSFLTFLDSEMVKPTPYGWFHLMCFAIVIAVCALIIVFRKKLNFKTVNIILLVSGIVMILFEIYKQIIMNFSNGASDSPEYPSKTGFSKSTPPAFSIS